MSIGSTIRMLRLKNEMTQVELAEKIGTSQSRVSAIESDTYGERHTLRVLRNLADALGAELIVKFKVKTNAN